MPRVLVIDNYDSFVYNLVQYLGELGAEPIVHRHDAVSLDEMRALEPDAVLHAIAATGFASHAVQLEHACPVGQLPGFADGDVSVQDAAAQLAAPLVAAGLAAGARVLDACAAPGGKAAHIMELADVDLLALDSDAQRLERVCSNLQRLHLRADVRQGDAAHCIFVEISGLKNVNAQLGNDSGDDVIVAVAEALREVTRATDVVARWGGDEFCVVGPGPGMAPLELEHRVRDTVRLHAPVAPAVWPVLVSAGGAMLAPWDSGTLETLLGKADQEMYLRRSLRREAGSLPQRHSAAPPAASMMGTKAR